MHFYIETLKLLAVGVKWTVFLTLAGMALGLAIGQLLALARLSRVLLFRSIAYWYIEIIRGTPLLVQLFILYFGLPQYGITLSPFIAGFLGLGINYGAYLAEVFRAGILSIPRGQREAATTLGLSEAKIMRLVILPQAIRVVVPPVGNYLISMLKDSALVSTISVYELLRAANLEVAQTFRSFDIYLVLAGMYFAMSYPLSILVRRVEAWLGAKA
jgi:cystine transport system permease protein